MFLPPHALCWEVWSAPTEHMISSLLRRVAAPTPTRLAAAAAAASFSAAAAAASCLSTGAGTTAGSGMSAQQYVDALGLIAHPEGGYFRETFRAGSVPMSTKGKTDESADLMPTPSRAGGVRNPLTSIYYMLTTGVRTLTLTPACGYHAGPGPSPQPNQPPARYS